MARPPRTEAPGGIHHVTSRGNRSEVIFETTEDYVGFLAELAWVIDRKGWVCLAYCCMPNHLHLVIETPEPNLGAGMGILLSRYSKRFNARRGIKGCLYGRRYWAGLVTTDEYLATVLRYVALNPVNGGLCEEPGDWPWSSHGLLLAGIDTPIAASSRVDELLGVWGQPAGSRYAGLLAPTGPWGTWADAVAPEPRPSVAELLARYPRDEALRRARWDWSYRLGEIAAATGLSESTISRRTRR